MATVTRPQTTAEDFLKMDLGEGSFELVRGEVVEVPPPGPKHGYVCLNVGAILREFGGRTGHGFAVGNDSVVPISAETVRGADVAYYSEARWPKAQVGQGPPPVLPDLVVEVYSPNDRPAKMLEKVSDYLNAGVPVVLVLHAEDRTLTIYRGDHPAPVVLKEDDVLEGLPELPGFRCPVAEFFA